MVGIGNRCDLVDALNTEWRELAGCHRELIEGWAEREPVLSGCRSAGDILARIPQHPDQILRLLITLDHDGVEPAGRIVLQTMLGKMVRMAWRDPHAQIDDYISQLWFRIRSYPLVERPRRIAANLALDTLKAVQAEPGRLTRPDRVAGLLDGPDSTPSPPSRTERPQAPAAELSATRVLRAACDLGLIDECTRRILLAVYAGGWSGKEVAEHLQISHAALRFRCSRAVRTLARESVQLAAAA